MSTKILCVLAVYAAAVDSAKIAHSSQYILKHDDHHHVVHVRTPVHGHHQKPHHDYYTNPKYDKYVVKPQPVGGFKPSPAIFHGAVREYYTVDEPDDTIRHVQILAEKHTGLHDVKHSGHPHHVHHYHHHHHHHHHKRESLK
ncbi:unnamed protein product [Chrysodeixis includens]|uniref:Uncharacterized protein n=1 Tax=Chrysodeixis includens TaxID=689277 RepID=A0A9P0C373_CHRIL|nr:unnamed protein product [Chrysodeixis includens]